MPDLPRRYWDACVFLSYVNDIPERMPHLSALLAKSGKDFQIVTSALSIVEVAFGKAEQDGRALDQDVERKINKLWDGMAVQLSEFYGLIALEAREIMRQALPGVRSPLKPMDAIHIATARRLGVAEFHTYDDKLLNYPVDFGFKIQEPIDDSPELSFPPTPLSGR